MFDTPNLSHLSDSDARALARTKAQNVDTTRWDTSHDDAPRDIAMSHAERAVNKGLPEEQYGTYVHAFLDALSL